jgi:hypothetical protein
MRAGFPEQMNPVAAILFGLVHGGGEFVDRDVVPADQAHQEDSGWAQKIDR